jgi:hypothetical protein
MQAYVAYDVYGLVPEKACAWQQCHNVLAMRKRARAR